MIVTQEGIDAGEREKRRKALDRGRRLTEWATPGAPVRRRSAHGGFDGSDARKVSRNTKESKGRKREEKKKQ